MPRKIRYLRSCGMVRRLLETSVMRLTRCALLLLAVTAGPANAGSKGERARAKASGITRSPDDARVACPEAGRAKITLPDGMDGIDGIRVFVTDAQPGAATDV